MIESFRALDLIDQICLRDFAVQVYYFFQGFNIKFFKLSGSCCVFIKNLG